MKQKAYITIVLVSCLVLYCIASTQDYKVLSGQVNLNKTGRNFGISSKEFNGGLYTDRGIISIEGGNVRGGFTIGIDNKRLFGSIHNERTCLGDCE